MPSTADTSSISPGAGCVCAQGTVAERRTADGLVASDRGTWGPISTVRGWAEGAPAWTRCGAGRSRCEGPAGPAWGCDFPINPHNWDSQVPSLGRWPEGTHTRRPPRACGAVPPASRRRPQACSAPAASPPEGLGALPPSHQHSLPTGLSARRTLLRRPRPACPLIRGYQTLLRRPRPTCPASWALETLFGRPCPTCPLVLGSGSHSSPGPVLPGSQPAVVSGQPGTNPTYKSSGESRFTKMCGPIPGAGWQETMGHLTMMPSPGMPASHTPASTPGELV